MSFYLEDLPETRYWFEEWRVLCTKYENGKYSVINGGWDFEYNTETHTRSLYGEVMDNVTCIPVEVTKEEFNKMQPNFGYW